MSEQPIVEALGRLSALPDAAFYAPGHKRGQGAPSHLKQAWGESVFRWDLPELPELDNLFAPSGAIAEAQSLAAKLWGADQTWFLVNGTTAGVIASILATCGDGDKILLPRNCHQSAIAGVIQAGAIPIFLSPEYDPAWDLALGFSPETLTKSLRQHPEAKAVMVLYPTYHGVGADLQALADITHQYGLPLIVDEAHGAHLGFHPDLPLGALALGADITVQSTHKTLGALSQASMLHCQGDRVSSERLRQALQLLQSTSPNYLLLASLDAARFQLQTEGQVLLGRTLRLVQRARDALAGLPGLTLLKPNTRAGFACLDPTRLTVDLSGLGLSGFEADEILRRQFQVTAELPSLRQLAFIFSIGTSKEDTQQLISAFTCLCQQYSAQKPLKLNIAPVPSANLALTPRQAFFSPTDVIFKDQAIGRISASLICPYPPGIPVLVPGEVISPLAIAYLEQVVALGGMITGAENETLSLFRVVKT